MTPEQARQTISDLIALVGKSDLADLELVDGDLHLRFHRARDKAPAESTSHSQSPGEPRNVATPAAQPRTVRSLLVGRFYRSRKSEEEPLVREGDMVVAGQVVGVVEAMSLFSEITSEESGRIMTILISDGDRIEYGQPLMELE